MQYVQASAERTSDRVRHHPPFRASHPTPHCRSLAKRACAGRWRGAGGVSGVVGGPLQRRRARAGTGRRPLLACDATERWSLPREARFPLRLRPSRSCLPSRCGCVVSSQLFSARHGILLNIVPDLGLASRQSPLLHCLTYCSVSFLNNVMHRFWDRAIASFQLALLSIAWRL